MSNILPLAELKGYVRAKLDHYDRVREKNTEVRVPGEVVADEFYTLLEIITDMIDESTTVSEKEKGITVVLNKGDVIYDNCK